MIRLSESIAVRRRYLRSVNLERDLNLAGSLDGYAVTPRAAGALGRVAAAQKAPGTARAWTITGVYGSGKSAFAHMVAALHGPSDSALRKQATALLRQDEETRPLASHFQSHIPSDGFIRAIVSGRREPVGHALLRALASGADAFWAKKRGVRPRVVEDIRLMHGLASKGNDIDSTALAEATAELAQASRSGLLLIIDELGKVLEDAGRSGGARDLFLLQQLAELSASQSEPIVVIGLLHQAFSEYSSALGTIERGEWEKVQGRFEDVPFTGPAEEMLFLVGRAIERSTSSALNRAIGQDARKWHKLFVHSLSHPYVARALDPDLIDAVYPLHPISALVLPSLCNKYAQNDRSLFTFLTSSEPHSLGSFLSEASATADRRPLLRIDQIYDYFVNVISGGLSNRPQFQRWAEIHGIVQDAQGLTPDDTLAIKAISALNLLGSTGPLRAGKKLVTAALLEFPEQDGTRWQQALDRLVGQRLVTYRSQVDEYRVWEGSDFDVEAETRTYLAGGRRSLAEMLTEVAALPPVVAQRHSYRTGTLRYFERQFVDSDERLCSLTCGSSAADGMIAYWVAEAKPAAVPKITSDRKPLVVAMVGQPEAIRSAVLELAALRAVERGALALQTDGVARREVRMRLRLAQEVLDNALRNALDPERLPKLWIEGRKAVPGRFRVELSDLCDRVYSKTPKLWNELINRRELTSQGARARRELIEALILRPEQERLGLVGEGPAYSMYASLLLKTGIHRRDGQTWRLQAPSDAGVKSLWHAVEGFCLEATDAPRSIDQLYALLEASPYGIKRGIIPVFLAAVLMLHEEDLTVYQEGTFVPLLGPEHFELLVRQPAQFAVKHFALTGLRREFFRDLEAMVTSVGSKQVDRSRNSTLLGVVRPLVRFAAALPKVTSKTEQLGDVARAVRTALLTSPEPDRLIFETLPEACGHPPFRPSDSVKRADYHAFRQRLKAALRELSMHYETLLERCRQQVHSAFGISSSLTGLREDLRVRAQYLVGQCLEPRLRSFIVAAARSEGDDRAWIESLAMIVGDRPVETWSDDDMRAFEANVSDMARRFANLEALQKEAARSHEPGYEARRVTITRADGVELSDLVWVDADQGEILEPHIRELLEKISAVNPAQQRHAIAVGLLERLLGQRRIEAEPKHSVSKAAKVTHG